MAYELFSKLSLQYTLTSLGIAATEKPELTMALDEAGVDLCPEVAFWKVQQLQ